MPVLDRSVQPLQAGEQLSREEFMSRWEALPLLKRAELIHGRVYLHSPVSNPHGRMQYVLASWLAQYERFTPGCCGRLETTWLMLGDAPQPDIHLVILPECGGQSRVTGNYSEGAPELAAEICATSKAHDLGPKLDLYLAAGVQEYLTVVLKGSSLIWRYFLDGRYLELRPDDNGILRSRIFPGLWLDSPALFAADARIWDTLERGLHSPEHEIFVRELAAGKART